MTTASTLLILGGSARAAAWSAARAGFQPFAGDFFADQDLHECCPVELVKKYPRDLLEVSRRSPPGDWLYTGGLENHPRLVDAIAAERRLLGNPGDVLRRVRNPFDVAAALSRCGITCPALAASAHGLPRDGTWLCKLRRSSGGQGIFPWDQTRQSGILPTRPKSNSRRNYFQERIDGLPCAAAYVAASGKARLLGITQQLIGTPWCGAQPFAYAGSIGPFPTNDRQLLQWERIGSALAEEFKLVGLFGVDAVLHQDSVWPIEVNPRYTASLEVLERTLGLQTVALHVAACSQGILPAAIVPAGHGRYSGKAVVYAQVNGTVNEFLAKAFAGLKGAAAWPQLADIPRIGSGIVRGWPICTVLADGTSPTEVEQRLQSDSGKILELLEAAANR
ncbi:MAG: ATP-grasp domain-containing protein [Pirellulales bacterium]